MSAFPGAGRGAASAASVLRASVGPQGRGLRAI